MSLAWRNGRNFFAKDLCEVCDLLQLLPVLCLLHSCAHAAHTPCNCSLSALPSFSLQCAAVKGESVYAYLTLLRPHLQPIHYTHHLTAACLLAFFIPAVCLTLSRTRLFTHMSRC
jgi:hypothetical protein